MYVKCVLIAVSLSFDDDYNCVKLLLLKEKFDEHGSLHFLNERIDDRYWWSGEREWRRLDNEKITKVNEYRE